MKKLFLSLIILLYSLLSFGQVDQKVADLLNNEDYLELRRVYPSLKEQIVYPMLGKLSEASIYLAFNEEPQKRIEAIGTLINNYGAELGLKNIAGFVGFLSLELEKLGQNDQALSVLEQLMTATTDKSILAGLRNNYNIVSGLSKIPQSELLRDANKSNKIKFSVDVVGADRLWYHPVEMNGTVEPFIFDTGAAGSFVSKNFAKKHNIKIVADSILMGGVGGTGYASLGVIDTIKVANIVYTNMPVYIGDTEYPKDSITIEAVLGVPFMKDAGAIKIEPKTNEITFIGENNNSEYNLSNVSLSGNRMLMELYCKDQRLLMFCDTGASIGGWINARVHQNNPTLLDNVEQQSKTIPSRGFAGSADIKTQRIPEIQLKVGDNERKFSDFQLVDQSNCDGELGVEFFKQCKEVVIDLNKLYLYIE